MSLRQFLQGELPATEWRSACCIRFLLWLIVASACTGAPILAARFLGGFRFFSARYVTTTLLAAMILAPPLVACLIVRRALDTPSFRDRLRDLLLTPSGAVPLLGARLVVPALVATALYMSVFLAGTATLLFLYPQNSQGGRYVLLLCYGVEILLGVFSNTLVLGLARLRGMPWGRILMTWGLALLPLHVCGFMSLTSFLNFNITVTPDQASRMETFSVICRIGLLIWTIPRLQEACEAYLQREVIRDVE